MNRVIITTYCEKRVSAYFQDKEMMDVLCEDLTHPSLLARVYIGKVTRVVQNIHAAFVDIGEGVDCYLSLEDNPFIIRTNRTTDGPLVAGDEVLVQVEKDAIKTKPPTLSGGISFASDHMVLVMGKRGLGISRKLSKETKETMQGWFDLTDCPYRLILRTSSAQVEKDKLLAEYVDLAERAKAQIAQWMHRNCFCLLREAKPEYESFLERVLPDGVDEVVTDFPEVFDALSGVFDHVRLYEDVSFPLPKLYSFEKQFHQALDAKVWLKSGAYLVIQYTEALTIIDVNSGKNMNRIEKKEHLFRINKEAAKEIARQVRLRNLSGIILVDFVNIGDREKEEALTEILQADCSKDPDGVQVLGLTKLRLMEMTRKKVRRPLRNQIRLP